MKMWKETTLGSLLKPRSYNKQPKDPKEKFKLTINGFLIDFLRENGSSCKNEILEALQDKYELLRTKSGNRYKGNPSKTLSRALSNNTLFVLEGNRVKLKVEAAEIEEASAISHNFKKEPKAYSPVNPVQILKRFRKDFLENQATAPYINKPLPGITGNEDLVSVANKLGHERFLGLIQGFHMAKLAFIDKINDNQDEFSRTPIEKRLEYIQYKLKGIDDKFN